MPASLLNSGIGIDIVYIPRILKLISGNSKLQRFLDRIYTSRERTDFHHNWGSHQEILRDSLKLKRCAAHIAGRWAAKEAVIKAATPRKVFMNQIEVFKSSEGYPVAILLESSEVEAGSFPSTANERGDNLLRLSISHDGDYAVAICNAS
ncbi:MAG: hypothetical protein M1820_004542 [Bogoriella megaspora]|nr:MAG: hypothetical protein M1820_004542 [Bogoriella megaspora]